MNAAGPRLQLALLRAGEVLEQTQSGKPVLEALIPAVRELLGRHQLGLASLGGVLFAEGPGSSLALRLATMTVRTWARLPDHRHWHLFRFRNLELFAVSLLRAEAATETMVYAPYRRDRLHRCHAKQGPYGYTFTADTVAPEEASEKGGVLFLLGNRSAPAPCARMAREVPLAEGPQLLLETPALIHSCGEVAPLQVAGAEPVRWSQRRHQAE